MAGAVFLLGAVFTYGEWFRRDLMPGGDFPGYAAQLQIFRDALLEHGRLPRWCAECFGGSSRFTSFAKEWLALPLALAFEPVTAMKLAWVLWRLLSAVALYAWAVRGLGSPPAGIAAGYAYAFGAVPNAQLAHLDMALAAALLPLFWIALCEHFQRGGVVRAAALAALTALLFMSHWVYAFVAPFAALGALALRPWPGRSLAPGWAARSAVAVALFLLFSASTLAWLVADAPHHWLKAGEDFAPQRGFYVERSPFLFFNRGGWLDGWLATHHPPGLDLARFGGDGRYLGAVVLAVAALGAALAPRGGALRAAAGVAAGLFGLQYWLALGPRTLLWELTTSLGVGAALQTALWIGLGTAALGCAAAALATARRDRRSAATLGAAAALLAMPVAPLWSGLAVLLPPLAAQRSPGHFFDTAPFWLCLVFAAGLAALLGRASTPARRNAWAAAALACVAIDFAPSRHPFAAGEPREPLRDAAALVAEIDSEGGTLRALPPPGYGPRASWLLSQSSLGRAWGWLDWQAGRAWAERLPPAAYGRIGSEAGGGRRLEPDLDTLAALRVRYFLLPSKGPTLPPPWQRAGRGGAYTLWSQPELRPYARGERAEADAPFSVEARRAAPERIELSFAPVPGPATLRVSESHHPWWRARAGGTELPLRRDGATLAVEVGAGADRVELRFERPAAVAVADAVGAAAWLGLAPGLALRALWRRQRGL